MLALDAESCRSVVIVRINSDDCGNLFDNPTLITGQQHDWLFDSEYLRLSPRAHNVSLSSARHLVPSSKGLDKSIVQ